MRKLSRYIFDLSPKKLAICLVLGPLVLSLLYSIVTIVNRNLSESSAAQESGVRVILGILALCSVALALLWLFWLRNVVYSVPERQLGLAKKWFRIAYVMLWVFIVFIFAASVIEPLMSAQSWGNDYGFLIYTSREFINFGGIIIAYPIVCHYAARAAAAKRNNAPATFVQAIPFSLLLIFGTVLGLPFLHKYFSTKASKTAQIIVVYAIAFALFVSFLILGFIAAITGLV